MTKTVTKTAVKHPSPYSVGLIPLFAELLEGHTRVLDPMAGIGKIHKLQNFGFETAGVELEHEWAEQHPDTVVGNALMLPYDDSSFDAICVSPTYGNRMADSHNAQDGSVRRSYTHDLGRKLHSQNSGAMHWGPAYRVLHAQAWPEAIRVLRDGGLFVLNVSDHMRKGRRQPVSAWHAGTLMANGLEFVDVVPVATRRLKLGENRELRVDAELVWVFRKPVAPGPVVDENQFTIFDVLDSRAALDEVDVRPDAL